MTVLSERSLRKEGNCREGPEEHPRSLLCKEQQLPACCVGRRGLGGELCAEGTCVWGFPWVDVSVFYLGWWTLSSWRGGREGR